MTPTPHVADDVPGHELILNSAMIEGGIDMTFGPRTMTAACWRLGLASLLMVAATGCSVFKIIPEALFMMTPDQEVRFGAQVAQEVEKRVQLVNDVTVLDYVRDVGNRVVRASPHSDIPIRFFVVKDDSINAFAIPGGNVYVNTGLLHAADDEAELASVMAHEVGHVVRRHGARQVSHTEGPTVVLQVITGDNAVRSAELMNSILSKGVMFNLSSQDEFEADSMSVRTLYNAGYDPQALDRLLNKLVQTYGERGPTLKIMEQFSRYVPVSTSSHPPTVERINRVESLARSLPPRAYPDTATELRRAQGRLKMLKLIQ